MPTTLEAKDRRINQIFEGSYRFEIPEYQRPYVWNTENTEALFDDLWAAMEDSKNLKNRGSYF